MIEIACKTALFHFNKKHLEDPTIPPWTIKANGKSYYVDHVTANIPWSTKEAPDSQHTKGAIKLSKALLTIDSENHAVFSLLTPEDLSRVRDKKHNYARILIVNQKQEIVDYLKKASILHGPVRTITGGCGSSFRLCEIKNQEDLVTLSLLFNSCYRVLQPNETYYQAYDDPELLATLDPDYYLYDEDDEDN